jgi:hypothetical protein
VANHFPEIPAMSVANLQYTIIVAATGGGRNSTVAGEMKMMNYGFESGTDGSGSILFDYGGFDQDASEAGMRALLTAMCTRWASILLLPLATVQASVQVRRDWSFTGVSQLGGSYPSLVWTDFMAYP